MTYISNISFPQLRGLGLGFDAMFDALEAFQEFQPHQGYPPYNLIRDGENYTLELALAGFTEKDLTVELKDNKLSIENKRDDATQNDDYIHRGIASRFFRREWLLHDDVVVKSAELNNGMLSISLEKIIPAEKKPKVIKIKS
jgi:molecular chaperone IbpA